MKKFATIELRDLAGKELVESMAHELEAAAHDDTRWPSRFAVAGPKSAPRWGNRFAASGLKSAPKRD